MPSRFDEPLPEPIELDKPYDIYVTEVGARLVVYRKAFLRGVRGLARAGKYDVHAEFFEIEQSNGQVVWVRRHSVLKFCHPGTQLLDEAVLPERPAT